MELLRDEYFGNSLQTWLIAVGLTIVIYFTALAVKSVVVHRLQIISNKTKNQWDDFGVSLIQKTRRYFLLALAALIGSQVLNFDISITRYFNPSIIILLLIQVWVWGNSSLNLFVEHLISKDRELQGSEEAIEGTMPAILFLGRLVLLSIVVLLALDNFGFNIRTLVASLGVGGIAVALAVQNILGDLFASLSIVLDKPFRVGDFVVVGDLSGNVEKIGLKTTRVRSLSGEQLVFANNDLLSSRIRNYKQMAERRVVFSLGVVYQTSKDKVMKVPGIIEEIVQNIDQTRFDRAHFFNFGASSLDFEVVYFVKSSDYKLYMDIQQKINSGILDAFEKEGIEFAYPTQTLFVEKAA